MTTDSVYVNGVARRPLEGVSPPPEPSRTLLLVEDSRLSSDAIRLMFRGAAGRLRRADCLRSARQHLARYTPDAVMVDLGLPDGSGLELISELARRMPRKPRIIALTGQTEMREACLDAGADVFMAKPIESVMTFRAALPPAFFPVRTGAERPLVALGYSSGMRDDLYLALDLLQQRDPQLHRDYALQFIDALARNLSDAEMLAEVAQVRAAGRPTRLALMLRERLRAQPLL